MKALLVVAFGIAFVMGSPSRAAACSCAAAGPPCEQFWMFDGVFAGRVASIETVTDVNKQGARVRKRVTLDVLEPFRNVDGATVEVFTGQGGGDCGYPFEIGQAYLVYARTNDSVLEASICSRTRPLINAAEDLAFARAVATSPAAGGTIVGEVRHRDRHAVNPATNSREQAPLPDIPIIVTCNGLTYRTRTDHRGRFEISGVAVGTCHVGAELTGREYIAYSSDVTVRDLRACASTSVVIAWDGHVSGRVFNAAGEPVRAVTVDLLNFPYKGPLTHAEWSAMTNEDGAFEITKVPPGRYLVAINGRGGVDRTSFGVLAYLPGVANMRDATVVAVGEGEQVTLPIFELAANVQFNEIGGQVLTESGGPAAGAKVYLHDGSRQDAIFATAITDNEGRFRLAVPAGEEWSLTVLWPKPLPEKSYNFERGATQAFDGLSSVSDLRIVVHPLRSARQ